jgi:hypothetical protein
MSGSTTTVRSLLNYFLAASVPEKDGISGDTMRAILANGLMQADNRGFSPLLYALYRYGRYSELYQTMVQLVTLSEVGQQGLSAEESSSRRASMEACRDAATEFGRCAVLEEVEVHLDSVTVSEDNNNQKQKKDWVRDHVHADTGGWSDAKLSLRGQSSTREREDWIVDDERCDIMEVWGPLPTAEEFFHKYLKLAKPIAFRGAAANLRIRDAFSKDKFVGRYGSERAPASVIPYASSFGVAQAVATLQQVADFNEPPGKEGDQDGKAPAAAPAYVFTVASNSLQRKLAKDAPVPNALNFQVENGDTIVTSRNKGEEGNVALQFYLGPMGSGAPVHYHGHAANTLAYGMKVRYIHFHQVLECDLFWLCVQKWFLFPPNKAFYSKTPALEFLLHDNRTSSALTCTQRGGDIFYVPTLWGHATLNLMQSIGVAHEFSIEPFCME